jgi:peptidyl-Lys metalloendopeptidase
MILKQKWLRKLTLFASTLIIATTSLNASEALSVALSADKENRATGTILVTFTNNSNIPIKVLKWNTALENELSSNIFQITNSKKNINYTGRLLKRTAPQESDYAFFDAKEQRTISIDLPQYYKMVQEGNYTISYKGAINTLSSNSKMQSFKKKSNEPLTISFIPNRAKKIKTYKITAEFAGCSQTGIDVINEAQDAAIVIAKKAFNAMRDTPLNTTAERYVTWFGQSNSSRQNTVKKHFENVYTALDTKKLKFDCNTCNEDGVFAYVRPSQPYDVYLCSAFWNANVTGTDSRAGTLVHELSHFTILAGTDDHVYGQSGAKELAKTSPDKAIDNADSHEYFAEDTPHLSMESTGSSNPFENAQEITSLPLTGRISTSGEEDIYSININKSGKITFFTQGSLDTLGILYDNKGNILAEADDVSRDNLNFELSSVVQKNTTYYLTVHAYKENTGDYQIGAYFDLLPKSDFNGDGIADILWKKGSLNALWYMKKDGKHSYKNIGSKATTYRVEATADFNGDGKADIFWKKGTGNYFWYMKANGKHTYKNIGSKPTTYKVVGTADFNGDGNADIFWRKGSLNALWYMKVDGKHTYKNIGSKSTDYTVAGIGDFNDDGKSDILWKKGKGYSIWYMNADGTHNYKYIGSKDTSYKIVGIGDFNYDGIADIFWKKGSLNALWYMKADGKHTYKNIGSKSTAYTVSGIGDYNNDGTADIFWKKGSLNALWYMNPNGTHSYKNIGSKSTAYITEDW